MIVMKFGGTSVQDAKAIERAGSIVKGRIAQKPVVVVSAMAKVTDQLLAMADRDQSARGIEHGQPKNKEKLEMATNLSEIDAGLTTELKDIVTKNGWPTIATWLPR